MRDSSRRLKDAQAKIAEEKLRRMRAEVIPAKDVQHDYFMVGGAIRAINERCCSSCQELIRDGLLEIRELEPQEIVDGDGEPNRKAKKADAKQPSKAKPPAAKSNRRLPAKKAANKSRVRGKVRQTSKDKPIRKRAV